MLKGISPFLSPELISVLHRMGHGDEIVFADAHFPGESFNEHILRADGVGIPDLLDAILPLFELDDYVDSALIMMAAEPRDTLDPAVESGYRVPIDKHCSGSPKISRIGRFDFYERTKSAFAVVMTGEVVKYGNIILKKGVTPVG